MKSYIFFGVFTLLVWEHSAIRIPPHPLSPRVERGLGREAIAHSVVSSCLSQKYCLHQPEAYLYFLLLIIQPGDQDYRFCTFLWTICLITTIKNTPMPAPETFSTISRVCDTLVGINTWVNSMPVLVRSASRIVKITEMADLRKRRKHRKKTAPKGIKPMKFIIGSLRV